MADRRLAPSGQDLEEVLYAAQAQRVRHAVVRAGQAQAQLLDQVQPVRARGGITRCFAACPLSCGVAGAHQDRCIDRRLAADLQAESW